jgi:signal transduction histidine kinase
VTIESGRVEIRPDDERLASLAEFAAGAGHEINNPLGAIVARAQQLIRDETDPAKRQAIAAIVGQAYRIRDMIGDVMTFARPPAPRFESVDLAIITRDVIGKLHSCLQTGNCQVALQVDGDVSLTADPIQLAIVVSELLRNAVNAGQPQGGQIEFRIQPSGNNIELKIRDQGQGFSEIEQRHAFDPFFSGRQAGRGLGFGLCKVWQILRMHRGEVEIQSTPGGPTEVSVRLPREQPEDFDPSQSPDVSLKVPLS